MYLGQQFRICDGYDLLKLRHLFEIFSVFLPHFGIGIILKAAHNIENSIFSKHDLKEGILVQEENILENLKQMVESLNIFQIFTNVEEVQKLSNVSFHLQGCGQLLTSYCRGQTTGNQLKKMKNTLEIIIFFHLREDNLLH